MRIYARDNGKQYADYLDRALEADVEAVQAANLPEMDDDAVVEDYYPSYRQTSARDMLE